MKKKIIAPLLFMLSMAVNSYSTPKKVKVLVFSKTAAFRHESIEAGIEALKKMAKEKGFEADFSEDAELFTSENLAQYKAIIFLNTTGDIFNEKQQKAFQSYIQKGGGYVGIHAATDTEFDWPWYGELAGAYFLDHPNHPSNVQKGSFTVLDKKHISTKGMPENFEFTDEFYNFKNLSTKIKPVLKIDDKSFIGGKHPDFHPISWYHEFDGGKAFYTALGHTKESFQDPLFLNHLWGGLKYAASL